MTSHIQIRNSTVDFLLLDVDEDTADNITHGQLRLFAPEDYAKAMETLVVPDGMYCPSIQL